MKSYDVTTQMKAPCLYLHMVLFVYEINVKIGRNVLLAIFGSEMVKQILTL